jgi:hypothetical protein
VSVMFRFVRVTLPLLVMAKVYVTAWPAAVTVAGEADFVNESAGDCVLVTAAGLTFEVIVAPEGKVAVAVAT